MQSLTEQTKRKILDPIKKNLGFYSPTREFEEDILPKLINGSNEEKKLATELLDKRTSRLFRALESEVHATLMESFDPRLHDWVLELVSSVIEENACTTETEKALATEIACSHIRYLDNSKRLNDQMNTMYSLNKEEIRYMEALSKQVDRAHSQFLSSIITLKQLKAPKGEMNIKVNTAFISDKQQINVANTNHENNESK